MKRTTFAAELLLHIDRDAREPVRLQLERELRRAIQAGRLEAAAVLPSTRLLAADLKVSRGVVVEAYEQLLAEGYLSAQRGSATRVAGRRSLDRSAPRPEVAPVPPRYDFRPGVPDLSLFPRRAWLSALRRTFDSMPDAALDYPDPRGATPARRALAAYLNRVRATLAREDLLVFCNGSAQGIGLLCRVLRERGVRRIAVEDPGYADQCTNIQASGLETPRVPVDDRGLRVDHLGGIDAGAVLVTPAHQYPTGAVLAPERRTALLEWAARRRAVIIEDDYDAEYRYDREPIGALQGLAPDRVVYIGTASKVCRRRFVSAGCWCRRTSSPRSHARNGRPTTARRYPNSSRWQNSSSPGPLTAISGGRARSTGAGATRWSSPCVNTSHTCASMAWPRASIC